MKTAGSIRGQDLLSLKNDVNSYHNIKWHKEKRKANETKEGADKQPIFLKRSIGG